MPIYMDRHNVSEQVTAEHVAQLHQEDLKIEHEFGCKGLTYWFDEKRKTAFCLIEAPNEQAVHDMHNHAHGELPHQIIEVDENVVESFLGRIEDPVNVNDSDINIIIDSAFRIVMVIEFNSSLLIKTNQIKQVQYNFNLKSLELIDSFGGNLVKQNSNSLLLSFSSVSKAVYCSVEIQSAFDKLSVNLELPNLHLKISLCGGVPVTDNNGLFEDSIKLAERMCKTIKGQIVLSSEIKKTFEIENLNPLESFNSIHTISYSDELFINHLLDYTEKVWDKTDLKIDDFSINLGISKSQLYRKMIALTDKSKNTFIKEYRLRKALKLLNKKIENISEIAFKTGFNSPTYFSKCFKEAYGIVPSSYGKEAVF